MSGPGSCELCEDGLPDGHDRVGGLALCRRCYLGELDSVVATRGWSMVSDHAEYTVGERSLGGSRTHYRTAVRIALPVDPALAMKCVRGSPWARLFGLVRPRARSRDPLFESHVRVWTEQPAQAEAFLRGPGVEGCVMNLLGSIGGSFVKIRGGSIEVVYVSDAPHTEGELVARGAVLAHYLERYAAGSTAAHGSPFRTSPRRG